MKAHVLGAFHVEHPEQVFAQHDRYRHLTMRFRQTGERDFSFKADSKGYEIITQTLADAEKISTTPATGGNKTFNDFGANKDTDNKIDFVFVKKDTKVLNHKVDTTVYNHLYPSDHFPVITKLDLSAPAQQ